MKKLLLLVLLVLPSELFATVTKTYLWKDGKTELTLMRNYGTPFSEKIRSANERKKAYRIFNLMRASGKELSYEIYWPGYDHKVPGTPTKLDIQKAASDMKIDIEKEENFAPFFTDGKLWNLRWEKDNIKLISGKISAYSSKNPYTFSGKKGNNLLINEDGTLKYLSEIQWKEVPALKDYTVAEMDWVSGDTVVSYVQKKDTGREYIVVSSVRGEKSEFIPAPPGKFRDVIVSAGAGRIYASTFNRGAYRIYAYLRGAVKWEERENTVKEPLLLGLSDGEVVWFDNSSLKLKISGRAESGGFSATTIKYYPSGKYLITENDAGLQPGAGKEKDVIYYTDKAEKQLKKYGISPGVYGIDRGTWLLPENYSEELKKLPETLEGINLSPDLKTLYYVQSGQSGLREIKSLKLGKPANVFLTAVIVLLVIVIAAVLFKRRN